MKAFYIGPSPFWHLWFSVPDAHESAARAFVESVAPWFVLHNDDTRNFSPWKVRLCDVVAAGAALVDPPAMREWSWPLPLATDSVARENIYLDGHNALIGHAPTLPVQWGPAALVFVVRQKKGPWRLWFGGPLREQGFFRENVRQLERTSSGGTECAECVSLSGVVPADPSDDFVRRNISVVLW